MSNSDRELLQAMIEQKTQTLTESDNNLLHGYKVFLSARQGGQMSLLELVDQSSLSAQDIISYLLEAGQALMNLHIAGYIYNAFTLEQVVYDLKRKQIVLREHALQLSFAQAREGVYQLIGAPGYVHPTWLMSARKDFIRGKRVKYSPRNDVYAFLRIADHLIKKASLRTYNPVYLNRLRNARLQVHEWKETPFDQLPHLSEVLGFLKEFEYESPLLRVNQGQL